MNTLDTLGAIALTVAACAVVIFFSCMLCFICDEDRPRKKGEGK